MKDGERYSKERSVTSRNTETTFFYASSNLSNNQNGGQTYFGMKSSFSNAGINQNGPISINRRYNDEASSR